MKRKEKSLREFTARELGERIIRTYEICPSKQFKSQLDIALKRGVSYGLLRKIRNRYRYESSPPKDFKPVVRKKKKKKSTAKQRTVKASSSPKKKLQQENNRVPNGVPRPTVPPPPDWTPQQRNLLNEPFPVIKKPRSC